MPSNFAKVVHGELVRYVGSLMPELTAEQQATVCMKLAEVNALYAIANALGGIEDSVDKIREVSLTVKNR